MDDAVSLKVVALFCCVLKAHAALNGLGADTRLSIAMDKRRSTLPLSRPKSLKDENAAVRNLSESKNS